MPNCIYSSDLKASGIFVILQSQDGFDSDCPETKFQTITSQSQFRGSRTHMLFKIGVFKNFATGKHLCWSLFFNKAAGLKVCNYLKNRLQHMSFAVDIAKLLRTAFFRTPLLAAFVSLINYSLLGICRPSFLNQKHNVGWLLLKRFADLVRVCPLHIISRNHSNKFLLRMQ